MSRVGRASCLLLLAWLASIVAAALGDIKGVGKHVAEAGKRSLIGKSLTFIGRQGEIWIVRRRFRGADLERGSVIRPPVRGVLPVFPEHEGL